MNCEYRFVGILVRSPTGRWAIKTSEGRLIEITSGEIITVKIAGHWITTRIECSVDGYYAVTTGVQLCRGMEARQ